MSAPTEQELQDDMDEFCATTSYDQSGDWRTTPATAEDPDEAQQEQKQ